MNNAFVIDGDATRRADVCRLLLHGRCHAEPFETIAELLAFEPEEGLVLVHDEDGSAIRLCEALQRNPGLLPVVGYHHQPVLEHAVCAMQAGTAGYLKWPFALADFTQEIDRILPAAEAAQQRKRRQAIARGRLASLTAREREVLVSLIAHGTNKAIAKQLDISPRTVEKYRATILVRLGVANTAQAIRLAVEGEAFDAGDPAPSPGDAPSRAGSADLIG